MPKGVILYLIMVFAPWEAIIKYNVLSPMGVFVLGGIYIFLKSGYFVLTSMVHGNFLPCAIETHIKIRHFEKLNKINHKKIHFQILFATSLDNYQCLIKLASSWCEK